MFVIESIHEILKAVKWLNPIDYFIFKISWIGISKARSTLCTNNGTFIFINVFTLFLVNKRNEDLR